MKVGTSQRTVDGEHLSRLGPSLAATETKDRKPEQDAMYFIANFNYEHGRSTEARAYSPSSQRRGWGPFEQRKQSLNSAGRLFHRLKVNSGSNRSPQPIPGGPKFSAALNLSCI